MRILAWALLVTLCSAGCVAPLDPGQAMENTLARDGQNLVATMANVANETYYLPQQGCAHGITMAITTESGSEQWNPSPGLACGWGPAKRLAPGESHSVEWVDSPEGPASANFAWVDRANNLEEGTRKWENIVEV
jgi:hypothetical protein